MLTSVLMISSGLNSSVAQRTRFFGMLRCLGTTRKQLKPDRVYWVLIPSGLVVCLIGASSSGFFMRFEKA